MSRSLLVCRYCHAPIGEIRASGILHPLPTTTVIFIDNKRGTTTFRCPKCAETIVFQGGRVDLDRKTA